MPEKSCWIKTTNRTAAKVARRMNRARGAAKEAADGGAACSPIVLGRLAQAQVAMPGSSTFQPTRESPTKYRILERFRDAKIGIWSHWGTHVSHRSRRLICPQHIHPRISSVRLQRATLRAFF